MGLDQYAYRAPSSCDLLGDRDDWTLLEQWRKHPNLQGWMERLWLSRGHPGLASEDLDKHDNFGCDFNCIPLELTLEDIDLLEHEVRDHNLPHTSGFFWGTTSDSHYRSDDLQFCANARKAIEEGDTVVYDSWW